MGRGGQPAAIISSTGAHNVSQVNPSLRFFYNVLCSICSVRTPLFVVSPLRYICIQAMRMGRGGQPAAAPSTAGAHNRSQVKARA